MKASSMIGITIIILQFGTIYGGFMRAPNCTVLSGYLVCREADELKSVTKVSQSLRESSVLYLIGQGIHSIDSDVFGDIQIKELMIEDTGVCMLLKEYSFVGLPNLEVLNLQAGAVFLPIKVFQPIRNLTSLTISLYEVSPVFSVTFSLLNKIKKLTIYNSSIDYLDADRFFSLSKTLETLKFNNCNISQICPKTFGLFRNLHVLVLDNNNLIDLVSDSFFGLSRCLYYLSLKSNRLARLPKDVFTGLTNLQVLDLSDNRIREILPDVFSNTQIHKLSLEKNLITTLSYPMFASLHNTLSDLNLRYNSIDFISRDAFFGLNLHKLDLSHNDLMFITSGSFGGLRMTADGILDLSANNLFALSPGMFRNSTITNLHLYDNPYLVPNLVEKLPEPIKIIM